MAMSHANHTHPSTPAGRAECRRKMNLAIAPVIVADNDKPLGHGPINGPSGSRKLATGNDHPVRRRSSENTRTATYPDLATIPGLLAGVAEYDRKMNEARRTNRCANCGEKGHLNCGK